MSLVHGNALAAVARRQLASFLGNPVGYLIILVFVVISGALLYLPEDYFTRNIADLRPLFPAMPWMLAVLVPALTMSAWTSEKEQGTEELLLTMPVGLVDAVIGKFLAVAGFFTIALAFNLSNVGALMWLGEPDLGLAFANLLGWWLTGCAFVAIGMIGSIVAPSQVLAFVIGILLCTAVAGLGWLTDWWAPFERGVVPLGAVLVAVAVTALGLGVCLATLAARRWRPGVFDRAGVQMLNLALIAVITVNCVRIAYNHRIDIDTSAEGVSSLSEAGRQILRNLPEVGEPIRMTVAVTDDELLPPELMVKATEVLDRALAIEREAGGRVEVEILRPEDELDGDGITATRDHNLETRDVPNQTVMGMEIVPVFLGATVAVGDVRQAIPFFDHGLSVEYEMIRAVRSVAREAVITERPAVKVTIAMSRVVPASLEESQTRLRAVAATLQARKDPSLTVELIELDDPHSQAAETLVARGIERRTVTAGVELDQADGDQGGPDDAAASAAEDGEPAATEVTVLLGAIAEHDNYQVSAAWLGDDDEPQEAIDDLIVDLRALADKNLPVVAILDTELKMNGDWDMMSQRPIPRQQIVDEWDRVYEVRTVSPADLNSEDSQDIDVLVAALPSSLNEAGIRELHDWIFNGRSTLMLVDPLPYFPAQQGRRLAPSEPRTPRQPQMPGMPPPPEEDPKGDLQPLLKALGLSFDLDEVLWSKYNPSPSLTLTDHFVWYQRDQGSILDHEITRGIDSVAMLMGGVFSLDLGGPRHQPLLQPNQDADWGVHTYQELAQRFQPGPPPFIKNTDLTEHYSAVAIGGRMVHAFENDGTTEDGKPIPRSSGEIDVVVVADTDLAHDGFFNVYRDQGGRIARDAEILARLRNVQFLANAVDVLAGDASMAELRTRLPRHRTLVRFAREREAMVAEAQKVDSEAREKFEQDIQQAREQLEEQIEKEIRSDTSIDEGSRRQKEAMAQAAAEKRLEARLKEIEYQRDLKIADATRDRRGRLETLLWTLRAIVLVVPALFMVLLVLGVWINKLLRERSDIPQARDRRKA